MSFSHSFAIMAYKDAPYIEKTIESILRQGSDSQIYISTSTPNDRIVALSKNYELPLYVNPEKKGIGGDWEFAMSCATTDLVTLVDQDDIYDSRFGERVLRAFDSEPNAIIAFSNYIEMDGEGKLRGGNLTMFIKHVLLLPIRVKRVLRSRMGKRMILRFGNPICSPSVTYNLNKEITKNLYSDGYSMSLDWAAWLKMTSTEGSFYYLREPLVHHRIHEMTQTSGGIREGVRYKEDLKIFNELWPGFFAKFLMRLYKRSYDTNK
ncbi:MAG: glycosyltransferase [Clostridiales bacterium]|nr:glycosyltransferase [Clostridiales bacterium]